MSDANFKTNHLLNKEAVNFISGISAGAISSVVLHPLELVKIRWQVYESMNKSKKITNAITAPVYRPDYMNYSDTLKRIFKNENGIRGLYRGCTINMVIIKASS
jgi:hypothetical protein